ncbi:GNAT family protein [Deinococcus sonorensis]|uniref:GNAT family protein n=2 Tax=Deinococcus sonorensis TaxID=309891 RepID=A0AAU7UAM5_9DEIO
MVTDSWTIRSSRLLLRPLQQHDAPVLARYRNDPQVAAFQAWPLPYTLEQAQALIEAMQGRAPGDEGWVQIAVTLTSTGQLMGDVALRTFDRGAGGQAEVGVTLSPEAQGQGYAQEALTALLGHVFGTLRLHRVSASIDPRNEGVRRLLERLGFRHEGTQLQSYWHRGTWTDDAIYALLREEWNT